MKAKIIIISTILSALGSVTPAVAQGWQKPTALPVKVGLDAAQVQQVKAFVASKLRYTKSARFAEEVRAVKLSDGSIIACGLVDAHDGRGRYNGNQLFAARQKPTGWHLLAVGGSNKVMDQIASLACEPPGMSKPPSPAR